MSSPRQTSDSDVVRAQRAARALDREVAPLWHDRFARLLYRELPSLDECFALDVHSGTGRTTDEVMRRLGDSARLLALQSDKARMAVAKIRLGNQFGKRVYLKGGDFDDVLEMDEDTYDLVVANLVLGQSVPDWKAGLSELLRVARPDGQILVTMPLRGTWAEVDDVFEEILRERGAMEAVRRLQLVRKRRPTTGQLAAVARQLDLTPRDYVVEHESFQLLFRSGRELLFSPLVELLQLPLWKAIVGDDGNAQEIFWELKTALDTYYEGNVIAVTCVAGLLRIQVPGSVRGRMAGDYWAQFPELDRLWGAIADHGASASDEDDEDDEFDLDIALDDEDDDEDEDADDVSGEDPDTASDDEAQPEVGDEAQTDDEPEAQAESESESESEAEAASEATSDSDEADEADAETDETGADEPPASQAEEDELEDDFDPSESLVGGPIVESPVPSAAARPVVDDESGELDLDKFFDSALADETDFFAEAEASIDSLDADDEDEAEVVAEIAEIDEVDEVDEEETGVRRIPDAARSGARARADGKPSTPPPPPTTGSGARRMPGAPPPPPGAGDSGVRRKPGLPPPPPTSGDSGSRKKLVLNRLGPQKKKPTKDE